MRPVIVVPLLVTALLLSPTAAAERFQSGELDPGMTFDHTFDASGSYTFHDHKNPTAEGTIIVMADSDNTTDQVTIQIRDDGDDVRFDPAQTSIEVGDTVRWTNSGSQVHQVMAWTEGDQMNMDDGDHDGHGHDNHARDDHSHAHGNETAATPGPALLVPLLALAAIIARRRN